VKEFLHQRGIEFEEKDVSKDEKALDALLEMGFQATPVTVIDGEAVVGFNKLKIEELLAR
jgi:glutaredoxin 3